MDARCLARTLAVCTLTASWLLTQLASAQQPTAAPTEAAASTASQNAAPVEEISRWTSRQRSFEIPFQLGENDTTTVVELYYSFSGGEWQLFERRRANDGKFVFKAERDGAYWFTSRTIDAQNRVNPTGALSAELLVIVDATSPQVEFSLEADEQGAVQCSWRIEDPGLAPQSLKLEYETGGSWQPIAVKLPPQQLKAGTTTIQGGVTWQPKEGIEQASVRLSIADAAGNLAQPVKTIKFNTAAKTPAPADTATDDTATDDNATARASVPRPSSTDSQQQAAALTSAVPWNSASQRNGAAGEGTEEITASPYYRRNNAAKAETLPAPTATPTAKPAASVANKAAGSSYELPAPAADATSSPSPATATNASRYHPQGTALAGTTGGTPWKNEQQSTDRDPAKQQSIYGRPRPKPAASTTPVAGPIAPAVTKRASQNSETAPLLFGDLNVESTNSTAFQLDYDVEAVGPEGVAKVELWVTRNRGQDWVQYSEDPDHVSPIDVEVTDDGLYGFRVQVTGSNGLGAQPPQSGDQADIWIHIDTTKPVVKLNNVPYGQGPTAGKLEIYWTAEDESLASRPVTLRYSEKPSGPWTTIAASIPNEGKYLWAIEANTPKEVYLRLEVTDKAGNVGVDQLADPVRLQPLIPKARIRGFTPVSRVKLGEHVQTVLVR